MMKNARKFFLLIIFLSVCVGCFSQIKIKERREISCSVLVDKYGLEKKRKTHNIDNITKYDTVSNIIEYIRYGEVSHSYGDSGSVGCSWNYGNIASATKYYYLKNKLITDSTFYYKNNAVDYFSSSTKYRYDISTSFLSYKEEFSEKNKLEKVTAYKYDVNSLVVQQTEIEDRYSIGKADTSTIDFTYDIKNRLIKEEHISKDFSWRREYEFDSKSNINTRYQSDCHSKFPYVVEYSILNKNGKPTTIQTVYLHSPASIKTTKLNYNENGLVISELEIPDYLRCDYSEPKDLMIYEYEYYK